MRRQDRNQMIARLRGAWEKHGNNLLRNLPARLVDTLAAEERFWETYDQQVARRTLLELLESKETLEESLKLMVDYYGR